MQQFLFVWLFSSIIFASFLGSVECEEIILYELPSIAEILQEHANENIVVRGFLCRNEEGQVFLTHAPDVKVCCLKNNATPYIVVDGIDETPSRQRAFSVEGVLTPPSSEEPPLQFHLQNSHLVSPPQREGGWRTFFWLCSGIAMLPLFIFFRSHRRSLMKKRLYGIEGDKNIS